MRDRERQRESNCCSTGGNSRLEERKEGEEFDE